MRPGSNLGNNWQYGDCACKREGEKEGGWKEQKEQGVRAARFGNGT